MGTPWIYKEGESDCCCAPVYNGICSKCREHCEPDEDEKTEEAHPVPKNNGA
jgi:hypothetical protein